MEKACEQYGSDMLIKDIIITHKHSNKTALIYGAEKLSYRELYNFCEISKNTISQSVAKNNCIGVFIPNSINYVKAYFTIALLDKVIVPVNPGIKQKEIFSTIEYCELSMIITDSKNQNVLCKYLSDYSSRITVFNIETRNIEVIGKESRLQRYKDNSELSEVALLLHTSGSLSSPKRVMLTHDNLISCVRAIIQSLKLTKNDRTLIALPMFLASANTSQLLAHLYLGASIVILDTLFTPSYLFKLVEMHKVTNFTGVPFMMFSLLENKNSEHYDISTLKLICFGGAPTPKEKIKKLLDYFKDIDFVQMYGQTEASTRISHLPPNRAIDKLGSVGKPIPGVEWKVVDESGEQVENGVTGDIMIKGRNVMKGYYKRSRLTEDIIKDGWLFTGDLGKLDDEGFMFIVGRKKNVIIKGGMNIYPEEIEEVLVGHPFIKEACVLREEHEYYGEVPVAKVVIYENDFPVSEIENSIFNYCNANLTSYKIPERVLIVKCLSKTDSGKVVRF